MSLEATSLCIVLQLNSIVSKQPRKVYLKYQVPFEIFMCIVLPCLFEGICEFRAVCVPVHPFVNF